ncbi:RNA polymerase II transcription factor [Lineolata rhizophorae]|uniref:RNA polymerase II transcription factor n=1 Tax=Lineolata rhizophorae TaxID=578093 RepID=A0A6A6P9D6_9PEZI|nr:RNA polymerase II transcription factor [Lineolata rhizophorae]
MSTASASYKKQDGTLAVSEDKKTVAWTAAAAGSSPALTASVADITNLQQTPATSAKVSTKLFVQRPGAAAPETHVFTFTSTANARAEQAAITDALRQGIEAHKAENAAPAASTPAAAASTPAAGPSHALYDDSALIANAELQRSLLSAAPALRQRFEESLREKPDSITISQFSQQFWATRAHLLRAHAVEKAQAHGSYNVLSEIKPKNVDGTTRLNLSKEQIQLIFDQHPLVLRVYNELVPQLSNTEFWGRFFVSRLFKRLKGEKITELDSTDPKLDKYLSFDEEEERTRQIALGHVPHFIDLEGNEQNHSQKLGNQPDWTMRPNPHDKVPILRVLNSMSEKMMKDVAPSDAEAHAPVGMDEGTWNELRLRDLQREADDNRVTLHVKDQIRSYAGQKDKRISAEAEMFSKYKPKKVLATVQQDLQPPSRSSKDSANLEKMIGYHEDSDSDDDDQGERQTRVGSRAARAKATAQVLEGIRERRTQTDDFSAPAGTFAAVLPETTGLSEHVIDSLTMTHNTTVEFLHYFWNVFLSGDESRAGEVSKLVETLDKSLDRIRAVADEAEAERQQRMDKVRKHNEEIFRRTNRRRRFDPNSFPGGAEAVKRIMGPTVRAIGSAKDQYQKALEAQLAAGQQNV